MHLDTIPIKSWGFKNFKNPFIIGGPCSAENLSQVMETAKMLAVENKISMLRAGIWKPRTRPNGFEGIGEEALKWLKDAGVSQNLPVITEVANAKHVELCLEMGIDALWIGARTTVNPFSVQEIADALRGTEIPVFVKNPINPDLNLWIGALERINQAGIKRLAAIHRGFSVYHDSVFRNLPMWEIPIQLKTIFPELDIICDPSHIAGNRELINFISQKALDLNMSGLMIESHINPDEALSDKNQQISPDNLNSLITNLNLRKEISTNKTFNNKLEELRAIIDEIDKNIMNQFKMRQDVVKKIGAYKKANDVTILQIERWREIVKSRLNTAQSLGISKEYTLKFLQDLHEESIRIQTLIMNEGIEADFTSNKELTKKA